MLYKADDGTTPKFTILSDRGENGAPSLSVTFPDGYTDQIFLSKHYSNAEDRNRGKERCNYLGHLVKEKDACVAMTGCLGRDDVQFTIMSAHAKDSPMFKWSKSGAVDLIENPFKVMSFRS